MTIPTTVTIDWLSYTVKPPKFDERLLVNYPMRNIMAKQYSGWVGEFEDGDPMHGYDFTLHAVGRAGLIVMMGGKAQQGTVHVSWSGSALKGNDVRERTKYALYNGGRCTRIDLAVDFPRRLDFRALFDACRAGRLDTAAKRASIIDSDTGTTVYVGSRSSEQYLRVYDKAAEQKVEGEWTRVELECKGKKANAVANYIVSGTLGDIPRIVRAFCDWPDNPLWEEVFAALPKVSLPKEEKRTDRERWYKETVRPALLEDIRMREGRAFQLIARCLAEMTDKDADAVNVIAGQINVELQNGAV